MCDVLSRQESTVRCIRMVMIGALLGVLILFHGCHVGGHDEDLLKVIRPALLAR
jgi:hypothetical protein